MNSVKEPTLCWCCKKAIGLCPWSEAEHQRPVKGWVAEEVIIKCSKELNMKSYCVIECPLFERDSYRNGLIRIGETK